jgi:hypothetical protein
MESTTNQACWTIEFNLLEMVIGTAGRVKKTAGRTSKHRRTATERPIPGVMRIAARDE